MPTKIFHHTPPLRRFTEWGCYPIAYSSTGVPWGKHEPWQEWSSRAEVLCSECATKEKHNGASVTPWVHWEGAPVFCEACDCDIESAYGDPEASHD